MCRPWSGRELALLQRSAGGGQLTREAAQAGAGRQAGTLPAGLISWGKDGLFFH